jgi:mannose-6-phosphate isomerase-like protein (cupin superfamily)
VTEQSAHRDGAQIIVRGPGEGHPLPGPEGITLKATGVETAGAVGFFEATSEPGFGPPRHIHHTADELFYVLDGQFDFLIGERLLTVGAGSFVFVPRGTVHAPKIVSAEPGRVLTAFVPGGQELAFEEFSELARAHGGLEHVPMEDVQAVARKYDSEFVGPPL